MTSFCDLLGKFRAAQREGWALRLRQHDIAALLRHHPAWMKFGLPESAAARIGKAYIAPSRPGVRLLKEEVATVDLDGLQFWVEAGR